MLKELLFKGGMIKVRPKGSYEGNAYDAGVDLRSVAKNGVVPIPVFVEMLKALQDKEGKEFLETAVSMA